MNIMKEIFEVRSCIEISTRWKSWLSSVFTSPPGVKQYSLYRKRFLQVKNPTTVSKYWRKELQRKTQQNQNKIHTQIRN